MSLSHDALSNWSAFFLHEGVDIGAASKHGIKVARIPSGATGNAASCAEMAIYLMLGLHRKQVRCFQPFCSLSIYIPA